MQDHTPDSTPSKQCHQCQNYKPATTNYFGKEARKASGLRNVCKKCEREKRAANADKERERFRRYRAEHPEKTSATSKKYYAANREKRAEYRRKCKEENPNRARDTSRKWRAANPERAREIARKWTAENRDKARESQRKFYLAHPERVRANVLRRRAIKRAAKGNHTSTDIKRQYENQQGRCYYCSHNLGDNYETDHVIPLSRGGSDGPENIVVACSPCNKSKGTKMPHEWDGSNRLL